MSKKLLNELTRLLSQEGTIRKSGEGRMRAIMLCYGKRNKNDL
jgi:hypothetical protein